MSQEALSHDQFHEHFMVEGRTTDPWGKRKSVSTTLGPFHGKEEAQEAISKQAVQKPRMLYYKPGTLEHS